MKRQGGGANQGYLFALPPRAGRLLIDKLKITERSAGDVLEDGVARTAPASTERNALIKSRVGQGQFRDDLLALWNKRCAVTGLDLKKLLRASHIKPWKDSNNKERLDRYNGLLLAPGYDAAFDAGLITFRDDGKLVISPLLNPEQLRQLGMTPEAQIGRVSSFVPTCRGLQQTRPPQTDVRVAISLALADTPGGVS